MNSRDENIKVFAQLGSFLRGELVKYGDEESGFLNKLLPLVKQNNGWFEPREVITTLTYWSEQLKEAILIDWVHAYANNNENKRKVGLVLAGNIPMVGFHDVLATVLSGHVALIKCSSTDSVLIPALLNQMITWSSGFSTHFSIVDKLSGYDAVLATGSNNTARHFESYFSNVPLLIRKNRTGLAILEGNESESEMQGLMGDCLTYFGLGCRSITKLFLPVGYDLNKIFKASLPFAYLMENNKYVNNYTYHKALMMLERKSVLENDLILMVENPSLFSPVSVLNYEFYENEADLSVKVEQNLDQIQCVIGHNHRGFGTAQMPALADYADGADTMKFLQNLTFEKLPN